MGCSEWFKEKWYTSIQKTLVMINESVNSSNLQAVFDIMPFDDFQRDWLVWEHGRAGLIRLSSRRTPPLLWQVCKHGCNKPSIVKCTTWSKKVRLKQMGIFSNVFAVMCLCVMCYLSCVCGCHSNFVCVSHQLVAESPLGPIPRDFECIIDPRECNLFIGSSLLFVTAGGIHCLSVRRLNDLVIYGEPVAGC
jgi:hypothetical protein